MDTQEQDKRLQARTPLILIVEDDEDARTIYSDYLSRHGYRTLAAASGEEGLALAEAHPLDLALLDIMMPGMSGREVAAWLRKNYPKVEIIFITALISTAVAVEEMHRGAFYYLTKPVSLRQLLEIVQKAWATRRTRSQVRAGDLVVDLRRGQATLEGEPVPLTPQESEVLVYLARRRGEVASYEDLWEEVWGYYGPPNQGLIQRTVSNLRGKVGSKGKIACVWGRGYRLG